MPKRKWRQNFIENEILEPKEIALKDEEKCRSWNYLKTGNFHCKCMSFRKPASIQFRHSDHLQCTKAHFLSQNSPCLEPRRGIGHRILHHGYLMHTIYSSKEQLQLTKREAIWRGIHIWIWSGSAWPCLYSLNPSFDWHQPLVCQNRGKGADADPHAVKPKSELLDWWKSAH